MSASNQSACDFAASERGMRPASRELKHDGEAVARRQRATSCVSNVIPAKRRDLRAIMLFACSGLHKVDFDSRRCDALT